MTGSTAVVWFRRDLRLHDHPALTRALEQFDRVVPLFVVDDALVGGRWVSPNRLWFMARSVEALADALAQRGAPLTIVRGRPAEQVVGFAQEVGARAILVSRDFAPYGRRRDAEVARRATEQGIDFVACSGVLAHDPEAIVRSGGGHFLVFGPFRRAWEAAPLRAVLPAPDRMAGALPARGRPAPSGKPTISDLLGPVTPSAETALLPQPGETAARRRLAEWAGSTALDEYDTGRDRLDRGGTSRLSQDLRWGLLSSVDVLDHCAGSGAGQVRFRSEICWRDFYAHLLWHQPGVARHAFRAELDDVAWQTDASALDAWREGRTGYPIVDAAMRQLLATGWMHNRARMIVASFLAKHLGVDWRAGEAHFMRHLLDGDVASNNGGWQWAASTGTDAQPYFRIFNPTLQARRHDPQGDYVRRWIPALAARADLPGASVHEPPPGAYIPPIVDHADARQRALAAYRSRIRRRA